MGNMLDCILIQPSGLSSSLPVDEEFIFQAFQEIDQLAEACAACGSPLEVCLTHERFIPCLVDNGCEKSADLADIKMVWISAVRKHLPKHH
jgi:hypothetical protein